MGNKQSTKLIDLGCNYLHGKGVEKDEHKAFVHFQKSAEMGNDKATNWLGYCYQNKIGVEKDENKAFVHYQKSAEMGNVNAINHLANCYRNGIGVEKDEHKAFVHYQKSAEMGNAQGIYNVGTHYFYGIGVEKNEHKAFIYYKKSADMSYSNGMTKVGYCYRNGIGTQRDLQKANYWYQMEKDKMLDKRKNENFHIDDEMKKLLIEEKYPLPWISYKEFDNIRKIGQGGFATVFCAYWKDNQTYWRGVALKTLHGSKSQNEGFIKELKAYCDISSKHPSFLKCHGISKDESSGDYILVLEYAKMGSLRQNLQAVAQMKWKDKITLLDCIASDLQMIHSQELIHRDLHSGNILQDNLHSAYIADLGLSISTNIEMNSEKRGVYGILPYIAPEILDGEQYTTASDIYSFGIIMWEILYGKSVSYNQNIGTQLQFEICRNDLRPTIIENIPKCYISLMKKCWEREPINRPSAIKISEILKEWQNDENILLELTKSEEILQKIKSTLLQTYSVDVSKSKFITYTATYYQDSDLNKLNIE